MAYGSGVQRVAVVRRAVLLPLALLCACGLVKQPLQPELQADVNRIDLARLEVDHILLIRRLNPVFAVMGSSGMVLDTMVVAKNAYDYKQSAGPVYEQCLQLFADTLAQALQQRGYSVGTSQLDYWSYYKQQQRSLLRRTDAILRIQLKQMGFWSGSLRRPFKPSLFVQAELIDPKSRHVLYSDRFAIGMDLASLRLMELNVGRTNALESPRSPLVYHDFSDLVKHAEQSRNDLFRVVALAARHVAAGFRIRAGGKLPPFDPQLYRQMPG